MEHGYWVSILEILKQYRMEADCYQSECPYSTWPYFHRALPEDVGCQYCNIGFAGYDVESLGFTVGTVH